MNPKTLSMVAGGLLLAGCSESGTPPQAENAPAPNPTPNAVALESGTPSAPAMPPPPPVPGGGLQAPPPVAGALASLNEDPLVIDSEEGFAVVISDVQQAVETYCEEKEVRPTSLQQVIQAGYLSQLPPLPPGKKFVMNPATMEISVQ